MSGIYIGLMSGTSVDAVDAVAVEFNKDARRVLKTASLSIPPVLRAEILSLCTPGFNELERMQDCANELTVLYAGAVASLLEKLALAPSEIRALGAHGQTIRHRPENGATTQMFNGSLLAELTGIDTVCDFRNRDIAAGGQGAPLVPPFHAQWFEEDAPAGILNLGGIANLTVLAPPKPLIGFDCGPANVLMDAWIESRKGERYDQDGAWAASGAVIPALLDALCAEKYFQKIPPKSTGRELFNLRFLTERLRPGYREEDVQATLLEFTAITAAEAVKKWAPEIRRLFLCGGGACNPVLETRLAELLPQVEVLKSSDRNLDPFSVEGAAFAWLAYCFINRIEANAPSVTGSRGKRILGCLYPA